MRHAFRSFLALACGAIIASFDSVAAGADALRPNIILILADDLGWADLGCYGADLHETPNLDRLAAQGLRFTQAYASAPVCTPTRAAILSGKHPARLHMTIWREATTNPPGDRRLIPPVVQADLPHSERTLAEVLHEAGYLTAHVGKWHLGEAGHFPETHGFDVHVGGNHWGATATHFYPFRDTTHSGERRYVPGLDWGQSGEYLADRLTLAALDVVRRAGDKPFFLNLWHYSVHTPIEAKSADVEHFQSRLTDAIHHRNAAYAAMVKNLDDSVGQLMAGLERAGVADRTIVIFSSDNGGYINAPGQRPGAEPVTNNYPLRSGKGSLYEGGLRVPLIVRWPNTIAPGSTCHEPVVSADWYRTLLEVAGVEARLDAAQQSDGVSLFGLLKEPQRPLRREMLTWHYPHYYPTTTPASAIRQGRWKLIEYYEDRRAELYDLETDPSEGHDLAGS